VARITYDHPSWCCVVTLCLLGAACGDEKAGPREADSSMSDESSMSTDSATEVGGIDGAGSSPFHVGNTSPDGPTVTTLGDFMVDVRSYSLTHYFDKSVNRLTLEHGVETPNRESFRFSFDYAGGNDSFAVSDLGDYRGLKDRNGFLMITEDGREMIARTGTVSIESTEGATVRVELDGIGVIPFDPLVPEDLTELRLIGSDRVGYRDRFEGNARTWRTTRSIPSLHRFSHHHSTTMRSSRNSAAVNSSSSRHTPPQKRNPLGIFGWMRPDGLTLPDAPTAPALAPTWAASCAPPLRRRGTSPRRSA
jgi:hypothetical protein